MIYFDNSATTRPYDAVVDRMAAVMREQYANPSSLHAFGAASERLLTDARKTLASLLGCEHAELFFTGSGTESDNLAILGGARAKIRQGRHLLVSPVEHAAVLEAMAQMKSEGFEVEMLPVDGFGRVTPDDLARAIRPDTVLASIMHVNNETGAVSDLAGLARACRRTNPKMLFHVDAVQGFGKLPINLRAVPIDLLSVSAHKIHGPKGVGALFVRKGVRVLPIVHGGGQEGGLRSGTQSVEAIAGFAAAAAEKCSKMASDAASAAKVRTRLTEGLQQDYGDDVMMISPQDGTPHVLTVAFAEAKSEVLLHHLAERGICCSSGSACSSNRKGRNPVLAAIGTPDRHAGGMLRFSFCGGNTLMEADEVLAALRTIYPKIRFDRR